MEISRKPPTEKIQTFVQQLFTVFPLRHKNFSVCTRHGIFSIQAHCAPQKFFSFSTRKSDVFKIKICVWKSKNKICILKSMFDYLHVQILFHSEQLPKKPKIRLLKIFRVQTLMCSFFANNVSMFFHLLLSTNERCFRIIFSFLINLIYFIIYSLGLANPAFV